MVEFSIAAEVIEVQAQEEKVEIIRRGGEETSWEENISRDQGEEKQLEDILRKTQ